MTMKLVEPALPDAASTNLDDIALPIAYNSDCIDPCINSLANAFLM